VRFTKGGDYERVDDVKERLKNSPDELKRILENGRKMTCEVTGKEMIQIPKYNLVESNEDILETHKKRKIEGEGKIKKAKVKKEKAGEAEDKEGEAKDEEGPKTVNAVVKPKVALTEAMQKRIGTSLTAALELHMNTTTTLCTANSPDLAGAVPKHFLTKSEAANAELMKLITKMQGWSDEKFAAKGEVVVFFRDYKPKLEKAKELQEKVQELLEAAQDE